VSFALRFGFDAIFAAIGFSGVDVDPDTVVVDGVVDVDPLFLEPGPEFEVTVVVVVVVDVGLPDDFAGLPLVVGFPVLVVVVLAGFPLVGGLPVCVTDLPLVVGLPVVRIDDVVGLPLVVGFPVLRGACVTGLPLVTGLTDVCGLAGRAPCPFPWANAGESVKHVAATKPRIVAETRIRIPPWRIFASRVPRGSACKGG